MYDKKLINLLRLDKEWMDGWYAAWDSAAPSVVEQLRDEGWPVLAVHGIVEDDWVDVLRRRGIVAEPRKLAGIYGANFGECHALTYLSPAHGCTVHGYTCTHMEMDSWSQTVIICEEPVTDEQVADMLQAEVLRSRSDIAVRYAARKAWEVEHPRPVGWANINNLPVPHAAAWRIHQLGGVDEECRDALRRYGYGLGDEHFQSLAEYGKLVSKAVEGNPGYWEEILAVVGDPVDADTIRRLLDFPQAS
jgi:hypothetical protein